MSWLIGIGLLIAIICIICITSNIHDEFKKFNDAPPYVKTRLGKHLDYTCVMMKFSNWKSLFEMDPTRFVFIDGSGGSLDLKKFDGNFRRASPCFIEESEEAYLIDFRYWDYFQYFFYCRKIYDKVSYISEVKMTKKIAEEAQEKIQAILDESQKKIEESLNKQKEIVLRLNTGENVKVGQTNKGE